MLIGGLTSRDGRSSRWACPQSFIQRVITRATVLALWLPFLLDRHLSRPISCRNHHADPVPSNYCFCL